MVSAYCPSCIRESAPPPGPPLPEPSRDRRRQRPFLDGRTHPARPLGPRWGCPGAAAASPTPDRLPSSRWTLAPLRSLNRRRQSHPVTDRAEVAVNHPAPRPRAPRRHRVHTEFPASLPSRAGGCRAPPPHLPSTAAVGALLVPRGHLEADAGAMSRTTGST